MNGWFVVLVIGGLAVVFVMPTVIAMIRGVESIGLVVMFNLIGAATGAGWFGAFVLACMLPRRAPQNVWYSPSSSPGPPNPVVTQAGPSWHVIRVKPIT